VESVSFYDHCFATDLEWFRGFAADYPRRSALPYRCHVPLMRVSGEVAALLAGSLCRWVHVHLGSGSRFIREEILSMEIGDEEIVEACRVLRQAGLHVVAEVFVGCPYESEITVEETLNLVRRAQAHQIHPRVFYPTPGTRAAELCAENGWISAGPQDAYWHQRSVLDMPSMSRDHIEAIVSKFPRLLRRPEAGGVHKLLDKVSRSRRRGLRSLFGRRGRQR